MKARCGWSFGVLGAAMAAGLFAGGCSKSEPPPPPPPAEKRPPPPSTTENWTAEQIGFLDEKFGKLEVTASGLRYKVLQPGTGEASPNRANLASVHYRGELMSGQVFDDSRRRGAPLRFRVGVGHVIKGWDEAVLAMKKGEKRLVVVPFWLGYGVNGRFRSSRRGPRWFSKSSCSTGRAPAAFPPRAIPRRGGPCAPHARR